jgi:hypothetical protein
MTRVPVRRKSSHPCLRINTARLLFSRILIRAVMTFSLHKSKALNLKIPFRIFRSITRMASSLEIVQEWSDMLDKGDFAAAGNLVADDMYLETPKGKIEGKAKWLEEAPKVQKEGVTWEALTKGATDTQVVCDGSKKIVFLNVKVMRVFELNDNGKIISIVINKK